MDKLPLITEDNIPFYYNKKELIDLKKEIEDFVSGPGKYMNDRNLTERFLGCEEVQANNGVEGYYDDARLIKTVIGERYSDRIPKERFKIIRNLYFGYKMILNTKDINKDTLKHLYQILSKGLLSKEDTLNMQDYYRSGPTWIHYSKNLSRNPDQRLDNAVDSAIIEECMESLFNYLNDNNDIDSAIDYYLKSQIAHFYFVYVHPYFDINGRTSRTTAMWYLINNEMYPFIIFNRGLQYSRHKYSKTIRDTKKRHYMNPFLIFMLVHLKTELEKEYIIYQIENNSAKPLSEEENQTLRYILSMKGDRTVKDFTVFHNRFNAKKHWYHLKKDAIEPLIDKDIINIVRYTRGSEGDNANFLFRINPNKYDSTNKIKRLKL